MTDKYVVFGNPVEHSMSPMIHEYFAKSTQQDLVYGRTLVADGDFANAADRFFNQDGGLGCNITVPCKLNAFDYADELSEYAKAAGAVNTLKKLPSGKIYGDNTDGRGLVADLKRLQCKLKGSKILIIGAGGAAKGIIKPIIDELPESVCIVNRTASKALDLAKPYQEIARGCSYDDLDGSFDVIINATSASLQGTLPSISDDLIAKASFVYDLMYTKECQTIFTKHAKDLGVEKAYDGFGMLIGQAILSFELWRGVRPDFNKSIEKFR